MQLEASQEKSYAYLLGQYLGDGCISEYRRCHRLRIFQDSQYPLIVDRTVEAMQIILPNNKPGKIASNGCWESYIHSKSLLELFPQHGPGKKHLRRIQLIAWQENIIDKYPWEFIAGLIHSDGCRYMRTVTVKGKEYRYPAYGFSNRSKDIRDIFSNHLTKLGVEHTYPPNGWQVHIYKKKDVLKVDQNILPKS